MRIIAAVTPGYQLLEGKVEGATQRNQSTTQKAMFCVASGNDLQMLSGLDSRTFLPSKISLIMRENPQHSLFPDSLCSSKTTSGSKVRRGIRSRQMTPGAAG